MKLKDRIKEFGKKARASFSRIVYRSSVTGRFVEKSVADNNPDTTQKEEV